MGPTTTAVDVRGYVVADADVARHERLHAPQLLLDRTRVTVPAAQAVRVAPALAVEIVRSPDGEELTPSDLASCLGAVRGVLRVQAEGSGGSDGPVSALHTVAVVVGSGTLPRAAAPRLVGCVLHVGGQLVATAAGALGGDPSRVASRLVAQLGAGSLQAGSLVVLGPLVDPTPVVPGTTVRTLFGALGSVTTTIITSEDS